ncbi:MAG: SUMF1/EgtB/PvdO family nonheme iron enzyme [Acidobacteria bacterium]|nr:SUMF1/EgtB/PvdO family nonheme iron enzyme [Acidobacteriota bacterium]
MSQTSLNQERRTSVFVSYQRETGTEFAQRLIADLAQAGHASWIDTIAIKGGDEWIAEIVAGINRADALLVVVTPEALRSRWVQREIWLAETKSKRIIPCLFKPVAPDDLFRLSDYQSVNFAGRAYEVGFAELLRALPAAALPTSLAAQRTAELAYLDRLALEELINTDKYTPLGGASQQQVRPAEMRAVFELLPLRLGKDAHALAEPRRFENAVAEIQKLRRAVLLGEPGAGKTTTLWKLAAELVERARQDAKAPLPLLIRLGRWTDAEQSLPAFITAQLGELGAHLDDLLKAKRAALLLDGLNELPAGQHAQKYPLAQRFIEAHPSLLAVVSCRALDYTIDLKFDRINITPLDPLRMQEFVKHYLGDEQGEALFWRLAGEGARQQLARFTEEFAGKLSEPGRVFWIANQLPSGLRWGRDWRGEDDNSIWQDWLRLREQPSSLMVLARNPYMLLMLASVFAEQDGKLPDYRGELFRLFVEILLQRERIPADEQEPLMAGLSHVAFAMQTPRAQNQAGEALTVLPRPEVVKLLNERLLYLAGCASLLNVADEVRFSHQLLQEYFAAKYMDFKLNAGHLHAADIWLPDRWWQRTNWEEAAILLAGLYSDDCTLVLEWLADAQPEIAAQCIVRSGAHTPEATRARLRDKWLKRLDKPELEPEPQARAAIGRALGQIIRLDNRPGVGVTSDGLPNITWIKIPGGAFQYGAEKQADDAEWYAPAKSRKLELPAFWISRYPITYAQFRCFAEDNGYGDPRWWEGLAANEDDRQPREQSFKFDNHPRDTVNWYEAIAFCRWLSWRWGGGYDLQKIDEWKVRLPTEFEWEKAARGTEGRLYPYAGKFDAAKGNVRETGIGQTSAVGIFPNGTSPYGVEEMSGNVWEWCLSDYEKPQEKAWNENLETNNDRVLRGGSWIYNVDNARSVCRGIFRPGVRDGYAGFRVVVVRPPSSS